MGASPPAAGAPRGKSDNSSARQLRGPYRQHLAERPGQPPVTAHAKRTAAIILEVLAGVRTPTSAAAALGIAVPRYYLWEQRAIEGLVAACQPRSAGRTVPSDRQIAELQRELAEARRELARQHALTRTAQRALGWMPTPPHGTVATPRAAPAPEAPKRRGRRPAVRALLAVKALLAGDSSVAKPAVAVQPATDSARAAVAAGSESRPAVAEAARRPPQQADQGGTSHAGRPKTAGNL
jgi:hypothetical protein